MDAGRAYLLARSLPIGQPELYDANKEKKKAMAPTERKKPRSVPTLGQIKIEKARNRLRDVRVASPATSTPGHRQITESHLNTLRAYSPGAIILSKSERGTSYPYHDSFQHSADNRSSPNFRTVDTQGVRLDDSRPAHGRLAWSHLEPSRAGSRQPESVLVGQASSATPKAHAGVGWIRDRPRSRSSVTMHSGGLLLSPWVPSERLVHLMSHMAHTKQDKQSHNIQPLARPSSAPLYSHTQEASPEKRQSISGEALLCHTSAALVKAFLLDDAEGLRKGELWVLPHPRVYHLLPKRACQSKDWVAVRRTLCNLTFVVQALRCEGLPAVLDSVVRAEAYLAEFLQNSTSVELKTSQSPAETRAHLLEVKSFLEINAEVLFVQPHKAFELAYNKVDRQSFPRISLDADVQMEMALEAVNEEETAWLEVLPELLTGGSEALRLANALIHLCGIDDCGIVTCMILQDRARFTSLLAHMHMLSDKMRQDDNEHSWEHMIMNLASHMQAADSHSAHLELDLPLGQVASPRGRARAEVQLMELAAAALEVPEDELCVRSVRRFGATLNSGTDLPFRSSNNLQDGGSIVCIDARPFEWERLTVFISCPLEKDVSDKLRGELKESLLPAIRQMCWGRAVEVDFVDLEEGEEDAEQEIGGVADDGLEREATGVYLLLHEEEEVEDEEDVDAQGEVWAVWEGPVLTCVIPREAEEEDGARTSERLKEALVLIGDKLAEMISVRYPAPRGACRWQVRDAHAQDARMESLASRFAMLPTRVDTLHRFQNFLASTQNASLQHGDKHSKGSSAGVLRVQGARGCGKSVLLAAFAKKLCSENPDTRVVYTFLTRERHPAYLPQRLCWETSRAHCTKLFGPANDWWVCLEQIIRDSTENIVFVVDGVDAGEEYALRRTISAVASEIDKARENRSLQCIYSSSSSGGPGLSVSPLSHSCACTLVSSLFEQLQVNADRSIVERLAKRTHNAAYLHAMSHGARILCSCVGDSAAQHKALELYADTLPLSLDYLYEDHVLPLLEQRHGSELIRRTLTHLVHEPRGITCSDLTKLLSQHNHTASYQVAVMHHDLAPFLGGAGSLLCVECSALLRAIERRYFDDVVLSPVEETAIKQRLKVAQRAQRERHKLQQSPKSVCDEEGGGKEENQGVIRLSSNAIQAHTAHQAGSQWGEVSRTQSHASHNSLHSNTSPIMQGGREPPTRTASRESRPSLVSGRRYRTRRSSSMEAEAGEDLLGELAGVEESATRVRKRLDAFALQCVLTQRDVCHKGGCLALAAIPKNEGSWYICSGGGDGYIMAWDVENVWDAVWSESSERPRSDSKIFLEKKKKVDPDPKESSQNAPATPVPAPDAMMGSAHRRKSSMHSLLQAQSAVQVMASSAVATQHGGEEGSPHLSLRKARRRTTEVVSAEDPVERGDESPKTAVSTREVASESKPKEESKPKQEPKPKEDEVDEEKQSVKRLFKWEAHKDGVLCLVFSNGKLYSGGRDNIVRVWDMKKGFAEVCVMKGHMGAVCGLEIVGDLLYSASWDGFVRLWDVQSGKCVGKYENDKRAMVYAILHVPGLSAEEALLRSEASFHSSRQKETPSPKNLKGNRSMGGRRRSSIGVSHLKPNEHRRSNHFGRVTSHGTVADSVDGTASEDTKKKAISSMVVIAVERHWRNDMNALYLRSANLAACEDDDQLPSEGLQKMVVTVGEKETELKRLNAKISNLDVHRHRLEVAEHYVRLSKLNMEIAGIVVMRDMLDEEVNDLGRKAALMQSDVFHRDDIYCLLLAKIKHRRVLFSAGIGSSAIAWDIDSKACLGKLQGVSGRREQGGYTKSFALVGTDLYGIGGDDGGFGEILMWDAETHVLLGSVPLPKPAMCHVCIGGVLVVGNSDGGLTFLAKSKDQRKYLYNALTRSAGQEATSSTIIAL